MEWGALVERYLVGRERRGEIGATTVRNMRAILRGLARHAGRSPGDLARHDVLAWLEDMGDVAATTRRGRFTVARGFVRWLAEEGVLASDVMAGMRAPKVPRGLPRAMQADKVTRLLQACPDARARLIVMLMVQLGLRCCEVAGAERTDIDWRDPPALRVRGKGSVERVVPLPEEALAFLEAYLLESPGATGRIVRSKLHPHRGVSADTVSGLVARWMAAADVKRLPRDGVSAHALRHTACTDMLRAGAHVRDVQAIMGHAHLVTTEIYMPLVVRSALGAIEGRRYAP